MTPSISISGGTISTDTLTLQGGVDSAIGKGILAGLIYPSKSTTANPSLGSSTMSPALTHVISSSFSITLDGSNIGEAKTFSASLNPNNSDYLFRYIGYNANNSKTS